MLRTAAPRRRRPAPGFARRLVPGLALALLLAGAPAALAAPVQTMGPWGYSRRISTAGQAEYVRVAIPDAVAQSSKPDLSDLRIADEVGQEMAYVRVPGTGGRPDLLFFRSPAHSYRLLYGNPTAPAPAYGLQVPAGAKIEAGSLGPQEANPFYTATPALRSLTWPRRYPFAFYSIAGTILVLLFGGMFMRTVVRVRRERRLIERLLAEERAAAGTQRPDRP